MRVSTVLSASSLLAIALAAPGGNSGRKSTMSCLNACNAGDVTCQASCVGTAHPSTAQVEATTQCAMQCNQGDGSAEASKKYSECVQACIQSHFPTSQTVVPVVIGMSTASPGATATTGSGTATTGAAPGATVVSSPTETPSPSSSSGKGSGSGSGGNSHGSGSGSGGSSSPSKTNAGKASHSTGAAASNARIGTNFAGLAGLLMAAFVL